MLAPFAWHGQRQVASAALRDQHVTKLDPAELWDGVLFLSGGPAPMNPLMTLALAFSMSADAFAAALGKGAALEKPCFGDAVRAGLVFGTVEAITPVVGWCAGVTASRFISAFDHWIAFVVLCAIGGKMLWDSLRDREKLTRHSLTVLVSTAIGTSIDAMAVGVTLALIEANIAVAALAIGTTTFALATLGIMAGRIVGAKFGRLAEALGGIILIVIGIRILVGHSLPG
jgi:manganese efflux pump family protein